MGQIVERRALLVKGAILAGGALAAVACGPSKKGSLFSGRGSQSAVASGTAYKLDPCGGDGCVACFACRQHATNKLFAGSDSVVRAHAGCDCSVTTEDIGTDLWAKLFQSGDNPRGGPVDRRWPWVGQII